LILFYFNKIEKLSEQIKSVNNLCFFPESWATLFISNTPVSEKPSIKYNVQTAKAGIVRLTGIEDQFSIAPGDIKDIDNFSITLERI